MCCGTQSHHASWHGSPHHGGGCTCGVPSRFGKCFLTEEEKAAWLERYLESLQEEVQAVEKRIAELKEGK